MDDREFRAVIVEAEFEEVRRRRESIDDDRTGLDAGDPYAADLTGLALSGGGIRSSTLGLGAIQALAREGVLSGVDYLSTVSGGGFVGGCLSSVLNDPSTSADPAEFPLRENLGGSESPELTQLRNSGKYLGPTGFFEKLRIPALLIRGMLINLFLLAPLIVLAVFLTELWAEHVSHAEDTLRRVIEWATVAFFLLGLIPPYFSYVFVRRFTWRSRQRYEHFFIFFLVLAVSGLIFYPISLAIEFAVDISWGQLIYQVLRRITLTTDSQLFWVFTAVVVLILVAAGRASQDLAKLRNRALMYVVGLLGPGIIFLIYALLCVWQIDSAYIPLKNQYYLTQEDIDYLERGILSDSLIREMRAESQPLAAAPRPGDAGGAVADLTRLGDDPRCEVPLMNLFGRSKRDATTDPGAETWSDCWRLESGDYQYLLRLEDRDLHVFNQWIPEDLARDGKPMSDALRDFLAGKNVRFGPGTYITRWTETGGHEICVPRTATPTSCEGATLVTTLFPRSHHRLEIMPHPVQIFDTYDWWFYGGAIGLLLLNIIFINVNFTSLHGFYRDQLTRGFLFRRQDSKHRDFGRRVKLSELNQPDTKAPYHLVNVTLNLQASDDENLRGRGADFFIFSKHWVGGERTGYVRTEAMERVDAHLDLGTAMAISGGAASPNAGSYDFGPLVFIMTMLNLRLDYWLPNPAKLAKTNALGRLWLQRGAGPVYVLREAVSALDERRSFVNLSDGGHLENMGIYQLLRRRCRRIICVDGEADPAMHCAGLVKLIRLAAIDLGVIIHIDLSALPPGPDGNSRQHFAVGEIDYGNGETGTLYYLKASMTGDENPYVTEYRQRYETFPHESTAEQFFTEEQFEAYRALGSHMATQLIAARPELRMAKTGG